MKYYDILEEFKIRINDDLGKIYNEIERLREENIEQADEIKELEAEKENLERDTQ